MRRSGCASILMRTELEPLGRPQGPRGSAVRCQPRGARLQPQDGEVMEDKPIPGYRFLVRNPDRLGGKPTITGTRFSVSFILVCLAEGMSYEDIVREYSDFPRESIAEVLRFAAEVTDRHDVAA